MKNCSDSVDKVRASRDGHEYHEAWVARRALALLRPDSKLTAIAVEGLSPTDQRVASSDTIEIADVTLYYGDRAFTTAERTTIAQFKYSVADRSSDFRASHAKKTLAKFAKTYLDYKKKYGAHAVKTKLDFELITNRPIFGPLQQAIESLAKGVSTTSEAKKQSDQLRVATGLSGVGLAEFASKLRVEGAAGSLLTSKNALLGTIVDWSATDDPIARARLGDLRQMVRDKAGHAGTGQNLIIRPDLLGALNIDDADDLLPCKPAIPEIGKVVERSQLMPASDLIPNLSMPLLIHAAAGVGKTVFLTSLASIVSEHSEVVFFDCFGGGAYRSPEDARHQPRKGLIHIVNTLAFRGLCDPMLPDAKELDSLTRTFRRRLIQSVSTLHRLSPGRLLVLFMDAIDNAELFAKERDEDAFPICLLESLDHEPLAGVKVIVSCRSDRKPSTFARYEPLALQAFSENETAEFLRARLKRVSATEVNVAQARSAGNPRVLDYLVKSGRGLLDESEINKTLVLDELIQTRISSALETAVERGYSQEDVNAFLAGLSVLPPPVPLDEYAAAHGMQLQEIESFAADLSPLLERTGQGLMFRDEPTETFIRCRYAAAPHALSRVAENLLARQDKSVYAARALPGLLHRVGDGDQLFKLAFDDRIPAAIASTVGKRNIRYARLKAAVLHSALKLDRNHLVELLVEISTLAAVDQRGVSYLVDNPDLVVAAEDADATRRLFEVRTSWPGARHARLAIANALLGESGEATRHAIAANEWIDHYCQSSQDNRRGSAHPSHIDIAAVPFFLICDGRAKAAARFLDGWQASFVFEVSSYIFDYSLFAIQLQQMKPETFSEFIDCLADVGLLAAAVAFGEESSPRTKDLIIALSKATKKSTTLKVEHSYETDHAYHLRDGLRKAAALGLSLGHAKEGLAIARSIRYERPSLWSLRDQWYYRDISPFLFQVAFEAAAKRKQLHEKDVLPKELVPVCKPLTRRLTGNAFREKAKQILPTFVREEPNQAGSTRLNYNEIQIAEAFLDRQLALILELTRAFADFLCAPATKLDDAFVRVLSVWKEARTRYDPYRTAQFDVFFRSLGFEIAAFALWTRTELTVGPIQQFLDAANAQNVGPKRLIEIISILARRTPLHTLAGEQALKARALIEKESDVARRASLFGDLARAMLPASIDDATVYFRNGLEQMDAIGSDDSEFVNELLLFASTMKGSELGDTDCHTLSNICELNMGEEPSKFYWGAFARAMSKVAGLRGLAKLSRWDDRSTIRLQNTLLPYLTALVEDVKIEPGLALVLNRLAKPIEYFADSTKDFAEAIERQAGTNTTVAAELIRQFQDDNPGTSSDRTLEVLSLIAERTLGNESAVTSYLTAARKHYKIVRDTANENQNYPHSIDARQSTQVLEDDRDKRATLAAIARTTNPTDRRSLSEGIDALNRLEHIWGDLRDGFFIALRIKVPFADRVQYVRDMCELEHLNLYSKLAELRACKKEWEGSSAALRAALKSAALPLIRAHSKDLVDSGRFSGYNLQHISDLTGVSSGELVLELIKMFARPERSTSGAVWLSFASFVSLDADGAACQRAFQRLLGSDAAQLASNVLDGPWRAELCTTADQCGVACGMVWRMLGSPYAGDRWRAAHSIRGLAKLERWDVVDSLVDRIDTTDAGPYQAPELPFYHLHARLWLLIALARIALDHPKHVARYKQMLLRIATETSKPHALMRHFASSALIACIEAEQATILPGQEKTVRSTDLSPHPRLKKKIRQGGDFYHGRPLSAPKRAFDFGLEYDFHKSDVDNLGHVFGKPCWEVADMLSEIVHELDPKVNSMYDSGGRLSPNRSFQGMTTAYQSHGEQLGLHALFFVAGRLLRDHPVTDDWWYEEDPWSEWLRRYLNTRRDGYWLSDGTDVTPLDSTTILLERAKGGLVLTADANKLMRLADLRPHVREGVIVKGRWKSPDDVRVEISSGLVPPGQAARLARTLTTEDPMMVWIPTYEANEEDGEYLRTEKQNSFTPWIVCPSSGMRLDEHDPFGVRVANQRPFLATEFASSLYLARKDPFGRVWEGKSPTIYLRSEAWGREEEDSYAGSSPGLRLFCSKAALRKVLEIHNKELLLLIKLERYEKESDRGVRKYTYTVGVVRITQKLDYQFYCGAANKQRVMKY